MLSKCMHIFVTGLLLFCTHHRAVAEVSSIKYMDTGADADTFTLRKKVCNVLDMLSALLYRGLQCRPRHI